MIFRLCSVMCQISIWLGSHQAFTLRCIAGACMGNARRINLYYERGNLLLNIQSIPVHLTLQTLCQPWG